MFTQKAFYLPKTDGEQIYREQCATCHQQDGHGVPGVFPPLSDSEWVTGDKGRLIRILLHGMSGPLEVKGTSYTGVMPPWKDLLSDQELAEVATYVRTSWSNEGSVVSEGEVRRVREATHGRVQSWTAEAFKADTHTGIPGEEPEAGVPSPDQAATAETANEETTKSEAEEASLPASESFEKVVLVEDATRPNVLDVTPDGRVFFAEREGAVRVWDPKTRSTHMVGFIPVNAVHTSGLLGLALDPNFNANGWIYLYYAPLEDDTKNELARFSIIGNRIQPESKRVILEVSMTRYIEQAHSAGDLAFGPQGNLFLSTGDNTNGTEVQLYAPIDERPGREDWDAQRTSANTNDLRGKILRIHPESDGSYTIPEGNLFPKGIRGRREIYVMGNRNPYRISVDRKTGWLYWGDVGPGPSAGSEKRGPEGADEFNRAREAGNYGWPYFVADNKPYREYDFATGESGSYYDPEAPVNDSPNNTGARVLPPAEPALIWYPKGRSEKFPELGVGGQAAMAGPLYRYNAEKVGPHGLPASFDGKLFIHDFMRNWIKTVTFDEEGKVESIRPFLPEMEFKRPMDMVVGPNGTLYVIEWGTSYEGWYNDDAQIVRIEYQGAEPRPGPTTKAAVSVGHTAPTLEIEWPVKGGVFDFNQPISYRLAVADAENLLSKEILSRPWLGHDTHMHLLHRHAGRKGTFQIHPDESHMYLEDEFAVLEACYATGGASGADSLAGCTRTLLQPRRKEAEHATSVHGAEREIVGSLRVRRDVQVFHVLEDGDYLSYAPVNLLNIESITFRVASVAGGAVEIRLDEPNGQLLAKARVDSTTRRSVSQEIVQEAETSRVGTKKSNWVNLTVPLKDPDGTHELFLVFRGKEKNTPLMKLDWFEFNGEGIMSH